MSSGSNNKVPAWLFLQWLTSPDTMVQTHLGGNMNPVRASSWADPDGADLVNSWGAYSGQYVEVVSEMGQYAQILYPPHAELTRALDRWAEAIQQSYFEGGNVEANLCAAEEDIASILDNFREILGSGFPRYLLNSMIVSAGAVGLALAVGLPAAYVLARGRIRAREHLAFTFLSFRFAPEFAIILPLFAIYQRSGLYDTYWGLIITHQLLTLPLVIWICRGFIEDVPYSLEEAALVDGAGPWHRLRHVVIPIIRPGIAAAVIIAFITSWNNLLLGLVLSGRNTTPVTMGILEAMTFDQIRWGEMAASAVIAAVPGVLIAVYLQRHLVRGLTMGAVKQ